MAAMAHFCGISRLSLGIIHRGDRMHTRCGLISILLFPSLAAAQAQPKDAISDALAALARTKPRLAVALAISRICPNQRANPDFQRDCNAFVGAALQGRNGPSDALTQITPDGASAAADVGQNALSTGLTFAGLGKGRLGSRGRGFLPAAPLQLTWSSDDSAMGDGGIPSAWGLFASAEFGQVKRDTSDNEVGYDGNNRRFTLGADYRFNSQWNAGLALIAAHSGVDSASSRGGLDSSDRGFNVFATYGGESLQFWTQQSLF
jgi:hypothetical protein